MQSTSSIPCPFCSGALHASIIKFENDVKPFMICPHCSKRVNFDSVHVTGGQGFHYVLQARL